MESGAPPVTTREALLRRVQHQVLLMRRVDLMRENWHMNLCSPFWRIYVNECAGAYIVHESTRIELQPDMLYVIPAGCPFQTGLLHPVFQNYIHFEVTGLPPALIRELFPRPLHIEESPLLRLARGAWTDKLGASAEVNLDLLATGTALVHLVMAHLMAESPARQRAALRWLEASSEMGPALRCIEDRLQEPPSNAELARLCGSSTAHFIRKFAQAVGMPPGQYSRQRRVGMAAQMLHEERLSLDEIAEATGFSDRFHLSRVFREHMNVPPAKYRRMHLPPR